MAFVILQPQMMWNPKLHLAGEREEIAILHVLDYSWTSTPIASYAEELQGCKAYLSGYLSG
eukprot:CAMPEP_0194584660 /NCGR_PEP_ID=MMETSP0292-20121207/17190_1 /TAXON_ID=39354 /ORGANISM="Heterosigma akashiwo, Strain CCMP2393" /LENGTH=60 /DNA_ID=CAMNT_0039439761 /DNA_START=558 /DNA_END=741 /DNA_ORIENTATION=+